MSRHRTFTHPRTAARRIAALLGDDGQQFTVENSGPWPMHLDDLAFEADGRRTYRDSGNASHSGDTYRWDFPDGSALLVAGDCWDFPLSRTAAKRQAHQESCVRRIDPFGSWTFSAVPRLRESADILEDGLAYAEARARLAAWRRERVEQLRFEMAGS